MLYRETDLNWPWAVILIWMGLRSPRTGYIWISECSLKTEEGKLQQRRSLMLLWNGSPIIVFVWHCLNMVMDHKPIESLWEINQSNALVDVCGRSKEWVKETLFRQVEEAHDHVNVCWKNNTTRNPGGFWSDDNFLTQIMVELKSHFTEPGGYKQGTADWGCEN